MDKVGSNEQAGRFDVRGCRVAVTGAGGVIFSHVSECLARLGASVALLDIAEERVKGLASKLQNQGCSAVGLHCDVLDVESLETAWSAIEQAFGGCDALINGAGGNLKGACVAPEATFCDLAVGEVDRVFALNYKGTLIPSQVFCGHFAAQGKGRIINTSSMSALAPLTNVPGYSNAKAAVTNFTRWLAVQVRVDFPSADILVNEIAPGFLDTTQNHHLLFEQGSDRLTRRGQAILAHTPMGRFGDPDELVGPIVMLLSRAGSFMHGATVCVDGGFDAYSGVGPLDEKSR